jgi:chemotaxis protein MotB
MAEQDENEVIEEEEEECPKCPPVGAPAWMMRRKTIRQML